MNGFEDFLIRNICSGRISEIIDIAENFFDTKVGDLHPEIKADILCSVKYSLQGTTQGRYLTGGVPPVRFSM